MQKDQIIYFLQYFIFIFANLITYAIIARVLLSWFTMGAGHKHGYLSSILIQITDPVLNFFKKIPHRIGLIDLSPIIAVFAIDILSRVLTLLLSKI